MIRRHRLYFPLIFLLLTLAAWGLLASRSEMDTNLYLWSVWAVGLLTALLTLLWFVLLSRFAGRLRLTVLGIAVLLGVGLKLCLRVDGAVSGTGLPRYVWRWTPPPQRTFAPEAPAAAATPPVAKALLEMPQFLGPDRNGILTGNHLSLEWANHPPRELWRINVGEGWGAFCVVGGLAITQEQRGEEERVTCYDLGTGKERWHHSDATRFVEWQGGDGPRATPTHDQGRLYTLGATGQLNCLDLGTGMALWSRNILADHHTANNTWGTASSPLILDQRVIVAGGNKPGPTLLAYDKISGAPAWTAGTAAASYASPVLATIAGHPVIVSANAPGLTLHDPATGSILLDYAWGSDKMPKGAQPIVLPGDCVFLAAGYGMGCVMLQIKAGADGKLTANKLWANQKMKTQFNSVTPVGELLIGLDDGRMACMDATTGERLWKGDNRYGAGQHLLVDGLALVQTEPGSVVLGRPSRDGFTELSTLPALTTKTWNYPTLAGRHLLLRNDREAVCFELPGE